MQNPNNSTADDISDANVDAQIKAQIAETTEADKGVWKMYKQFFFVFLVMAIFFFLMWLFMPLMILGVWPLVFVLWLSFIGLAVTSLVGMFMFTTQQRKIMAVCTLIACIVIFIYPLVT